MPWWDNRFLTFYCFLKETYSPEKETKRRRRWRSACADQWAPENIRLRRVPHRAGKEGQVNQGLERYSGTVMARGVWALPIFETTKASAFSTNAQSWFAYPPAGTVSCHFTFYPNWKMTFIAKFLALLSSFLAGHPRPDEPCPHLQRVCSPDHQEEQGEYPPRRGHTGKLHHRPRGCCRGTLYFLHNNLQVSCKEEEKSLCRFD